MPARVIPLLEHDARLERETELTLQEDPAEIQTWDLLNTSQMLSPLSHRTHGRGVKPKLLIAAQARGLRWL